MCVCVCAVVYCVRADCPAALTLTPHPPPDVLLEELSLHVDRTCEFYVYSSLTDQVRVVVIMPSRQWGGQGILGAHIAHGFLHGLPSSCCGSTGSSSEISLQPALMLQMQEEEEEQEEEQQGRRQGGRGGEEGGESGLVAEEVPPAAAPAPAPADVDVDPPATD